MSKQPPFSLKQQERLLTALDKIANMVDDGSSPLNAVVKVAKDMQLNSNLVERICHAYNTGTQENQRTGSDNLLEKFATFETLTTDRVLPLVFDGEVKQAEYVPVSQDSFNEDISPESIEQEMRLQELRTLPKQPLLTESQVKMAKFAETIEQGGQLLPHEREFAQRYADDQYGFMEVEQKQAAFETRKQAEVYTAKIMKAKELAHQANYNAQQRLADTVVKVANILNELPLGKDIHEIEFNAHQRFPQEKLASLLEVVHPLLAKERQPRVKIAEYKPDPNNVNPVNWNEPIYRLIKVALAQLDEALELKEAHDHINRTYDHALAQLHEVYPTVEGEKLKRQRMAKMAEIVAEEELRHKMSENYNVLGETEKEAGVTSIAAGGTIAAALQQQLGLRDEKKEKQVMRNFDTLMAPDLDLKKKQLRAEFLLNDMMNSDPVIGSYDPNLVLQYYNEISEIAPNAAMKAGIIRPALRRALQGNQEMFEGKALLDADRLIRPRAGDSGSK